MFFNVAQPIHCRSMLARKMSKAALLVSTGAEGEEGLDQGRKKHWAGTGTLVRQRMPNTPVATVLCDVGRVLDVVAFQTA